MTRRALSPEQAAEVRRLYAEPGPRRWTQAALAAQFGVSTATIARAINPEILERDRLAIRERYRNDPEFRDRHRALCHEWRKNNREYRRVYERAFYRARRAEARA